MLLPTPPPRHTHARRDRSQPIRGYAVDFNVFASRRLGPGVYAEVGAVGIFAGEVEEIDSCEDCEEAAEEGYGVYGVGGVEAAEEDEGGAEGAGCEGYVVEGVYSRREKC